MMDAPSLNGSRQVWIVASPGSWMVVDSYKSAIRWFKGFNDKEIIEDTCEQYAIVDLPNIWEMYELYTYEFAHGYDIPESWIWQYGSTAPKNI